MLIERGSVDSIVLDSKTYYILLTSSLTACVFVRQVTITINITLLSLTI